MQMMISGETLPTDTLLTKFIYIESFTEHNLRTGNSLVMDNWLSYQEREEAQSFNKILKWSAKKDRFLEQYPDSTFADKKPKKYIKQERKIK